MGSHGGGSIWYNELGSVLTFKEVDKEKGTFYGTYCSKVGDAEKEYVALGRFDTTQMGAIGWTVSWENKFRNAHSVTTWSGQFQYDSQISDFTILTTWLLTVKTDPKDDWNSTNIGADKFVLLKPTPAITEHASLRCQRSHPKNA